ncbi:hypothetical protein X798_07923, partial [Onchocerca flexuosa]
MKESLSFPRHLLGQISDLFLHKQNTLQKNYTIVKQHETLALQIERLTERWQLAKIYIST